MQCMSMKREDKGDLNTSINLTTSPAALATAPTQGMGIKAAAVWSLAAEKVGEGAIRMDVVRGCATYLAYKYVSTASAPPPASIAV